MKLDPVWATIRKDYHILKTLGKGAYGHVVEAQSKKTGEKRAIKHIKDFSETSYSCTQVLREIQIMKAIQQ